MSKPKFITEELREDEGKAEPVTDAYMINVGKERYGFCEACGKSISKHYGVKLERGSLYWVGSECKKILCRPDAQPIDVAPGTAWTDNGKTYVKPTEDWIAKLEIGAMGETYLSIICRHEKIGRMGRGGLPVKNQFLFDIWLKLREYGQITDKQYAAANKSI